METHCEVVSLLKLIISSNGTANYDCPDHTDAELNISGHQVALTPNGNPNRVDGGIGKDIYAYSLPWIIIIGLLGNIVSLRVFTSRQLRKLSASLYLIALSTSDSVVLLTYVLLDWLSNGLPQWPGGHKLGIINVNGICQSFLFLSYTFRFVSVYLIVVFTVERYIAVCKPLQRRRICTKSFARRIILVVVIVGAILSIFKPLLSGVYRVSSHAVLDQKNATASQDFLNIPETTTCRRNDQYDDVNFIMELIYGLSITAVPFGIITIFNLIILYRLVRGDSMTSSLKIQKNRIRLELTVMLLAISTTFILLNLPYFVVWIQQFLQSIDPDDLSDGIHIQNSMHKIHVPSKNRSKMYLTKTVFDINYAINFFVYCMTGTYYRSVITRMLSCKPEPSLYSRTTSSPTLRTDVREMSLIKTKSDNSC